MRQIARKSVVCLLGVVMISGCASHSRRAVTTLDGSKPEMSSQECKSAIAKADAQDTISYSRMLAAPVLVLASGVTLAVPLLAANLGLETYDHVDAASIAKSCGGEPKSAGRVALEVGGTAAVGVLSGGFLGGSAGDASRASVGR
jgi:hypothetical protein